MVDYTGLYPVFGQRLEELRKAALAQFGVDPFSITSGYRSPEQQAQIIYDNWNKFDLDQNAKDKWMQDVAELGAKQAGEKWEPIFSNAKRTVDEGRGDPFRNWIGLPARSYHQGGGYGQGGLAADIKYANPEVSAWIRQNAANYGLNFPLSNEPWHIELAGVRDGKVPAGDPLNAIASLGKINTGTGGDTRMLNPMKKDEMSLVDYLKNPASIADRLTRRSPTSGLNPIEAFAAGLDALILPEMRMGDSIREQGLRRAEQQRVNMTADWFAKQKGGEIYSEMLKMGVPVAQVYTAYAKAQQGDYVVVGSSLVDRKTGKVVFTDPNKGGKIPMIKIGPNGEIEINPPEMKADQSNALMFGDRMDKANQILALYEKQGGDFYQNFLNQVPWGVGRVFQSEEFKSFDDARRDFVNAVLRRESGAAIGESEFESAAKQYFPVFGDSDQQIEEKRLRRERAAELLKAAAGPEANKYLSLLDAEAKKINPKFGTPEYDEERKKASKTSKKGNQIIN